MFRLAKNLGRLQVVLAVAFFTPIFVCLAASAQTSQGSIRGEVRDPAGALVSKAQVIATNLQTGVVYKTITDGAGLYNIVSLNAGSYRVEVTASGFERTVVDKVLVSAAEAVEMNVELSIGNDTTVVKCYGAIQSSFEYPPTYLRPSTM